MSTRRLLLGVMMWLASLHSALAGIQLGQKGWDIEVGDFGKMTLSYPRLGAKPAGPTAVELKGKAASLTYANGCTLAIEQAGEGVYQLHFQSIPDDTKKLRLDMPIPFALKGKASWTIDGKSGTLAEQYGGKPMLFQGDAKRFALKDPAGKGFAIIMPFGFQQLQDNREWKTNEFSWFTAADMPGSGEAYMQIKIADTPEGDPQVKAGAAPAAASAAPAPAAAPVANAKPKFTLSEKNLGISAGTAGTFGMSLPAFEGVQGGKPTDPQLSADKKTLTLKYPAGGTAKIVITDDTATISFADLPAGASKVRVETMIPITFNSGGKYSISGGQLTPFPKDKPAKPFLHQGNADAFSILHPSGAGWAISGFEQGTFHQLQDNREWNWGIFSWWFSSPLPAGNPTPSFTLKLASPQGGSATVKPLIDRFGQHMEIEFAGKVKSEDELKADFEADKAYYASLTPPQLDKYGGLPGSGEKYKLKKTGFFHLEKIGATDVMVDPEGNLFFQLGICSFASPTDDYTTVKGRERIYEWLPAKSGDMASAWRPNDAGVMSFYIANRVRKFGKPFDLAEFRRESIDRIRKWGFNSAGAFTGIDLGIYQEKSFPYVSFLPLGTNVAPELPLHRVWDPFAPGIEEKMDAAFEKSLTPRVSEPLLIGYFITNEPIIEDVPKTVPGLKGSKFAAKRRLVQLLQEKYKTVEAFNEAWNAKAQSFEAMNDLPLIVATKTASQDMQDYFKLFLDTRYSLINKYFRKHDPNHLLIGDRWMPGTANSEALVRTAGKYLDIVSINYYAFGIEKSFLDKMYEWSGGKPMILSEFYYATREQGLMGGMQAKDQLDRGLGYRNYVEQAAATGKVVGVQWFSFVDQAATGRFFEGFNGEAANIGLLNVADRPYKTFLAEAMKTNYGIYDVVVSKEKPFVYDDPRFAMKQGGKKVVSVYRMRQPAVLDGNRQEWPPVPGMRVGESGLVLGVNAKDFETTYRLAYDDKNLYVFAEMVDPTPMANNNKDESIWSNDSVELFIGYDNLDQGGALQFSDRQILIRGGKAEGEKTAGIVVNAPKAGYKVESVVLPGSDGKSYTIEAAIPFEALGFMPKPGMEVLFDICVNDSTAGRRQLAWNGTKQNSKDRGAWGRAAFTN